MACVRLVSEHGMPVASAASRAYSIKQTHDHNSEKAIPQRTSMYYSKSFMQGLDYWVKVYSTSAESTSTLECPL